MRKIRDSKGQNMLKMVEHLAGGKTRECTVDR